ncbi:hypothetical protein [Cohnella hashimotonis]|uniref:Uncharacterized protein n=1 Tax=Cohnella hashimotonis TaxID=2826895 RepID=A0ABT6TPQ1_9BACL|nr:hypothetical protein [Cohnella hashimotonis]MDI4648526.1 hypothetical protein [Cohnella hashimotonis]
MSGDEGWMQALASWTVQALDDVEWQVYANAWPADYARPAVLWRLAGIETKTGNAAFGEETRRYAGHVLGRDPAEEADAVARLTSALGAAIKLPLDAAQRRYLIAREAVADLKADAVATGQLSLTLSRKNRRPSETAPLMREIAFQQKEG